MAQKRRRDDGLNLDELEDDTFVCCFDYNVSHRPCYFPDCPFTCIYVDNGQEDPGQWMECKKGRGSHNYFCHRHREHEVHSQVVDCAANSEEEEDEEEEEEE